MTTAASKERGNGAETSHPRSGSEHPKKLETHEPRMHTTVTDKRVGAVDHREPK